MPSRVFFTAAILATLVSACAPSTICRNKGFAPGTAAYNDCVQSKSSFQIRGYDNLGAHPNP